MEINQLLLEQKIKERGFSQRGLAINIGISRGTIHNLLYNQTHPSYGVTCGIVKALKLTPVDVALIFFPSLYSEDEYK